MVIRCFSPSGERDALLPHDGVVPSGNARMVSWIRARRARPRCRETGLRPPEPVLSPCWSAKAEAAGPWRSGEQREPVLAHVAVDEDPASRRVVEARQEAQERRLPRAVAPTIATVCQLDAQADVVEHPVAARILRRHDRDHLAARAGRPELGGSVGDRARRRADRTRAARRPSGLRDSQVWNSSCWWGCRAPRDARRRSQRSMLSVPSGHCRARPTRPRPCRPRSPC